MTGEIEQKRFSLNRDFILGIYQIAQSYPKSLQFFDHVSGRFAARPLCHIDGPPNSDHGAHNLS
jgi:hypothetical protein